MASTAAIAMTGGAAGGTAAAVTPFGLWPQFAVFLKIGAALFGSGYVLLAFLRADLVQRLGWLTERQLLDAVAVGQITPGPVFTTATFIGFLLGGTPGAVVATVGIFLPAFVFRGAERSAGAPAPAVADGGRGARRRERRLARAHGGGHLAARAGGAGRFTHGRDGPGERGAPGALPHQFGVAGARWGGGWTGAAARVSVENS